MAVCLYDPRRLLKASVEEGKQQTESDTLGLVVVAASCLPVVFTILVLKYFGEDLFQMHINNTFRYVSGTVAVFIISKYVKVGC